MTQEKSNSSQQNEEQDVSQNAGARAAQIDSDPSISLEEARNAAEGKGPNAAGGEAPSTAEEHVPSNSSPHASDLPSSG